MPRRACLERDRAALCSLCSCDRELLRQLCRDESRLASCRLGCLRVLPKRAERVADVQQGGGGVVVPHLS